VAAELKKDPELKVETASGGLGELSVVIDGGKQVKMRRFGYPRPSTVVKRVKAEL
jgi:hypothetical protein